MAKHAPLTYIVERKRAAGEPWIETTPPTDGPVTNTATAVKFIKSLKQAGLYRIIAVHKELTVSVEAVQKVVLT